MKGEHRGYWWVPSKPDTKVHGTLIISSSERSVLELDGSLIEVQPFKPVQFAPDIVLGQSMEGTLFTLLKCIQTDVSFGLVSGLKMQKLIVQTVLIGTNIDKPEDVRFKSIAVEFSGINKWVNVSGFDLKHEEPTTTITYKRPDSVSASINEGRITIDFNEIPHYDLPVEVGIKQQTLFEIETTSEASLDEFDRLIYHLQRLLALAVQKPVVPISVTGYTPKYAFQLQEKTVPRPIQIIFRYDTRQDDSADVDWFIEFSDFKARFEAIVKRWFEKATLFEPVLFGYFTPLYYPKTYLEQKFLLRVQAIESYHRRFKGGLGVPPELHSKIVEEIVKISPPEHKNWFCGKLMYNEPSLRSRLKKLIAEVPWIDFGKAFVNDTVATRNYLTHYDPKDETKAKTGRDLLTLSLKLELLIKIILLRELDFDAKEVERIVRRTRTYRFLYEVVPGLSN